MASEPHPTIRSKIRKRFSPPDYAYSDTEAARNAAKLAADLEHYPLNTRQQANPRRRCPLEPAEEQMTTLRKARADQANASVLSPASQRVEASPEFQALREATGDIEGQREEIL